MNPWTLSGWRTPMTFSTLTLTSTFMGDQERFLKRRNLLARTFQEKKGRAMLADWWRNKPCRLYSKRKPKQEGLKEKQTWTCAAKQPRMCYARPSPSFKASCGLTGDMDVRTRVTSNGTLLKSPFCCSNECWGNNTMAMLPKRNTFVERLSPTGRRERSTVKVERKRHNGVSMQTPWAEKKSGFKTQKEKKEKKGMNP